MTEKDVLTQILCDAGKNPDTKSIALLVRYAVETPNHAAAEQVLKASLFYCPTGHNFLYYYARALDQRNTDEDLKEDDVLKDFLENRALFDTQHQVTHPTVRAVLHGMGFTDRRAFSLEALEIMAHAGNKYIAEHKDIPATRFAPDILFPV